MHNPLPTDLELLVFMANQYETTYWEVYDVWRQVHQLSDAYLITETVLFIAATHSFPLNQAFNVWRNRQSRFY